jgi:peptide methionine sulfoxide reductase msrA/msrB
MKRSSAGFVGLALVVFGGAAACTPTRSADVSAVHETSAASPATGAAKAYPKPSTAELEARLTPLQFEVTQNAATEPPFQNAYWNNHAAGLYVDVATGQPLFSSQDKFESGTGWPSFTKALSKDAVDEHVDTTLGMERTEVLSKGGSHLGHVFDDGPPPAHTRYCMNSASLRFIPVDRLAAEGYGEYASRFGASAANASAPPPDATQNACAQPPPGKTAGCSATLEVAIFAKADGDDRVAKPAGVLEVAAGFEGTEPAVEVTFDPSKVTYAKLLEAWTKGREKQSRAYVRGDAQKQAAATAAVRVNDAVPFRRQ